MLLKVAAPKILLNTRAIRILLTQQPLRILNTAIPKTFPKWQPLRIHLNTAAPKNPSQHSRPSELFSTGSTSKSYSTWHYLRSSILHLLRILLKIAGPQILINMTAHKIILNTEVLPLNPSHRTACQNSQHRSPSESWTDQHLRIIPNTAAPQILLNM